MPFGIVEQICQFGRVNVGEPEQTPREVGGVVVRAKDTAKVRIEDLLQLAPQIVPLLEPAPQLCASTVRHLQLVRVAVVHLNQLGQHLQPVGRLLEVLPVQRLDFVLQLGYNCTGPPAVLQRYVRQIGIRMVTEIQHPLATMPSSQFLELPRRTLKVELFAVNII